LSGMLVFAAISKSVASSRPMLVRRVMPATDGKSTAAKFTGEGRHRVIPNAGHNWPQENPAASPATVWEIAPKKVDECQRTYPSISF
jgi:hypothetical protein